jgi:putative hydrolase of the HAD superfamily
VPAIKAIFWDVGGVLLTNAWDHHERAEAFSKFTLDGAEFEKRHQAIVAAFETGEITLDQYLDETVFYREHAFTRDEFKSFMYSCSRPKPEVLELARRLGASRSLQMGTINNESRELNHFRIEKFGLREPFGVFVSSCFVRLRKPDPAIYCVALDLTQRLPGECCFIDDRPENIAPAQELGMHGILLRSHDQLRHELQKLGVRIS